MRLALCAFAAGLLAACASTGEQRAETTELCAPFTVKLDRQGEVRARPSPQQGEMTKASCTANRAELQIAANRSIQRQNEVRSFPSEAPPN